MQTHKIAATPLHSTSCILMSLSATLTGPNARAGVFWLNNSNVAAVADINPVFSAACALGIARHAVERSGRAMPRFKVEFASIVRLVWPRAVAALSMNWVNRCYDAKCCGEVDCGAHWGRAFVIGAW